LTCSVAVVLAAYEFLSAQQKEVEQEDCVTRQLGLPYPTFPPDNPITRKKIALGRKLFFDKRLSSDNSISCATCHDPNYGFADPHRFSVGTKGRGGDRRSPTVLNVAFMEPLMWDGRASTLEDQVLLPFASPAELDLPLDVVVAKLTRNGYSDQFEDAFGKGISQ